MDAGVAGEGVAGLGNEPADGGVGQGVDNDCCLRAVYVAVERAVDCQERAGGESVQPELLAIF
jgi:hypothetical protein